MVLDQFLQPVVIDQEGELFIGGVGVFAGYLHRDDLTAKALVNIDGHLFYRTGDLVRLDNNGCLYYVGRKDHQVKLRGQRIELGEIEGCILRASTNISACVVVKRDTDSLVAYIQSKIVSEKEMREFCQAQLPVFMVPSIFVVLEQLPLNSNGKVDRNRLPSIDLSILTKTEVATHSQPENGVEERVHTLWCEVLKLEEDQLSTTANFFSVGGHSLLLIQLYHRYQSSFGFDTRSMTVAPFLRRTTIKEHAKILESSKSVTVTRSDMWQPLLINEGNMITSHL